jgi:hypothetical protein
VNSQDPLDPEERGTICIFAAAMFARVDRSARTWNDFLERLHAMTKGLEDQHNAEPNASLQTAAMLENSRPQQVGMSLQMLSAMYYKMSMAIFVASSTACLQPAASC